MKIYIYSLKLKLDTNSDFGPEKKRSSYLVQLFSMTQEVQINGLVVYGFKRFQLAHIELYSPISYDLNLRGISVTVIKSCICTQGPSGSGQGLPGVRDDGGSSLEDQPADVRKLFWRGNHLYSGDHMGSICRSSIKGKQSFSLQTDFYPNEKKMGVTFF